MEHRNKLKKSTTYVNFCVEHRVEQVDQKVEQNSGEWNSVPPKNHNKLLTLLDCSLFHLFAGDGRGEI